MEMAEARTYPERETESERGPLIPPGSIFIISKSAAPAARSTRRRQRHSARKSVGRGQAGRQARGPSESSSQPDGKPTQGGRWASQGPGILGRRGRAGPAPPLPRLLL